MKKTKCLSILIVLFSCYFLALPCQAKYSGGTGEPNNPYRIATPNDVNEITSYPEDFDDCFILVSDINMAAFTFTEPLIYLFRGTFDGNDCIISNIKIDHHSSFECGFFGTIGTTGKVKNLGIEDVNIINDWDETNGTGGLVGYNTGTISNCHTTGTITMPGGMNDNYGGLCGFNSGTITNCYSNCLVLGQDNYTGGLCGLNAGTISNCYATGNVLGYELRGGLCGQNNGTISNCYATGNVPGNDALLGGLCGLNFGTINNCYFLDSSDGGGPDNGLGASLTDTQMKQQKSFAGWDFAQIWLMNNGATYPILRQEIAGDLNSDGTVNMIDFAVFANHWLWEK